MALSATYRPSRPPERSASSESFADRFAATCRSQSGRCAILDGDSRLDFARWAELTDALATGLARAGVCPGDTVAFQLPNWWETCVVFTAIAKLGAIANPLLPIWRERELAFILRQSAARHIFVPRSYRGTDYPELVARSQALGAPIENVFTLRDGATADFERLSAVSEPPEANGRPDDLLLLMYTSGTTADPKGVLHTHRTLLAEVESLGRIHALTMRDSTLMPSPLTHISGLLHGILCPALLGTSAVLMDRWEPQRATQLIERERVTYMVGAPVFLQDLLAADVERGWSTSLRLFSCGGATVSADLMRRAAANLGCVAKRAYGSTEFPTISTTSAADAASRALETEGRPIPPNEIRIVDETGHLVPPGIQGEIQARGPECFVGYADRHLNGEAFTADGWFRTGDLGTVDGDGYLTITGRIKEIVIRKGEKISIREVEDLLAGHPHVSEACVVGVADDAVGERVCAAIAVREGTSLSRDDVLGHLRSQGLAAQKLPERIQFTRSLPRTESGKVHRAAVAALFAPAERAKGD